MRKVAWHLLPLLGLGYFVTALARFNLSVAALTMNRTLGLSVASYAFCAAAFFWSYIAFQLPATLVMARVSARQWLAIILAATGAFSASTAFVTGVSSFVSMRFLLGIAEAGFFPAVTWYLTRWFPVRNRPLAMGVFYAAGAAAGVIGLPVSGQLLRLDGQLGLHGWQHMFLFEAIPTLLVAAAYLLLIRDRPVAARWLSRDEAVWLEGELVAETRPTAGDT